MVSCCPECGSGNVDPAVDELECKECGHAWPVGTGGCEGGSCTL